MFDTSLNQTLAQSLADGAPKGWQTIMVDAEVGEDYIDMGIKAKSATGVASFALPEREQTIVEDTIFAIRKDLTQASHAPWSHCNITLSADGDFKFDVKYDD